MPSKEGWVFLAVSGCWMLALADTVERPERGSAALTRRKRYVVFPEGSSFSVSARAGLHGRVLQAAILSAKFIRVLIEPGAEICRA